MSGLGTVAREITVAASAQSDGITVSLTVSISSEAIAHAHEAASRLSQDGNTADEARQTVNDRLLSAMPQWLAQAHDEAVQSLAAVACDALCDEMAAKATTWVLA